MDYFLNFGNKQSEILSSFRHILPDLNTLFQQSENNGAKVYIFNGLNNMKEALWYNMDTLDDFVGFYATAKKASPELLELFLTWNKQLAKNNIHSRAIVPEHSSLKIFRANDNAHLREVKRIKYKDYPSETSIEIQKDFIRVINVAKSQCLIIHDSNLALVLRNIFEMVWSNTTT